ncbi:MAG: hypothetical protein NTZ69_14065 [Bacteroidia bacterium]|nr:hypothetical protein [Bacteroidia bacterium]
MKRLIITLIALIYIISFCQSQTLIRIEFKMTKNGLLTTKIPYGTPFIIYGNIAINKYDTASIIKLDIKDVATETNIQSLEWNNNGIDRQFEFIVSPLEMDRKLEFSLAIYGSKYSLIEELTTNTLASVKVFYNSNGYVNESDVDSIFKSELSKLIYNGAKIGYFKGEEFVVGFLYDAHYVSAMAYLREVL